MNLSPYLQQLQLENAVFSPIDHEEATVAIVYKITQPNGTECILKICTRANDYLREIYFLKHLAGQIPIARLIQVVPPKTGIHGAILMECLRGTLLNPKDLTDSLVYEIGAVLARIHIHRLTGYGDLIYPQELSQDPRIPFALKFEESFSECTDHLPKALLEQCHRYYKAHVHLLASLDGPCMIHRDFRPGNVIVHQGKLQGIIDWASGRASFAEEDFCPLEHEEWGANPATKKSFLAGYASIRPVPNYKTIMTLLRLSRATAILGFMLKNGTWNGIHARVYQFHRHFLETLCKTT